MGKMVDMTGKLVLSEVLEHIGDGDSVMLTATGRSMLPTFRPNVDKIVLSPVTEDQLNVGDVIFFNRGDAVCVHRIIARKGDRLIIRGDGNSRKALEPARISSVFAKVTSGTMRGGKPFNIEDKIWQDNTQRVMKYFPQIAAWHWVERKLRMYPLSILVMVVLLYLSFFDPGDMQMPSYLISDKFVHALMYFGVSSIFWFEWVRSHLGVKTSLLKGFIYCMVFPILLGGLIELAQSLFTTTRGADWGDVLANIIGVALATGFSFAVVRPLLNMFYKRKK